MSHAEYVALGVVKFCAWALVAMYVGAILTGLALGWRP